MPKSRVNPRIQRSPDLIFQVRITVQSVGLTPFQNPKTYSLSIQPLLRHAIAFAFLNADIQDLNACFYEAFVLFVYIQKNSNQERDWELNIQTYNACISLCLIAQTCTCSVSRVGCLTKIPYPLR